MKFILTRIIVVYLVFLALIWCFLDYHQFRDNAVLQTMSRLTPPIDYFTEFVDKKDHFDRFKLMDCVYYHKAVASFFPYQKAEAYGMLGFCHERLGEENQAVAAYNQAIASDPDYFWPYYNLGVIYYRQAQYAKAGDYFSQALQQSPIKTIVFLSRSKVYNDIRLSKQQGVYDFILGLKQGRTSAYILLMDCLSKTGAYDQLLLAAISALKEGLDAQGIFYYYAGVAAHMEGKEDAARFFISKGAQLHQQDGSTIEQYLKPQVRFF
jgi:tetratricopeptide (TPR) repeat protein